MEKSCTHEGLDLNLCPYCEVERLRAENEALTESRAAAWEQCDTYKTQIGLLHDEVEALREENAQLLGYDNYAEQQAALAANGGQNDIG